MDFHAFALALGQGVLEYVLPLLTAVIAGFVAYGCRYALSWLKAHSTAGQLQLLLDVAAIAVQAAEKTGVADTAVARKDAALATVTALAASKGIKFDPSTIDAAIESAVQTELTHAALPAPQVIAPVPDPLPLVPIAA
jgi:hypothetical protein